MTTAGVLHCDSCTAASLPSGAGAWTVEPDGVHCPGCRPYRILVTGGRDWDDRDHVHRVLAGLVTAPVPVLVHGDQGRYRDGRLVGLDRVAARVAEELGWRTEPHPAWWDGPCSPSCPPGHRRRRGFGTYCPTAGPRRNRAMAELGADLCIVWPGGRGTADMVRRARAAGIPVRPAVELAGQPAA